MQKDEPALDPEDLPHLFVERANAGDVQGIVRLYEADATLACPNGHVAVGSEAIRRFYAELLAQRPTFTPGEQQPTLRNDALAVTSSRLENGAVTVEVARR